MSRYAAPTALQLALLDQMRQARASSFAPMSQAAILESRGLTAPSAILAALAGLLEMRLVSHCRFVRDGDPQDTYWPTGLKPITPPTQEELSKMSESKTARLLRLIAAHGPIDSIALTAKANGEGANILAKNLAGLLAASVKSGTIITSRPDKYTLYEMAPPPVAQASSLPPDDDDAMPPTDPGLLALANRALGEQLKATEAELSAALADQKAESDRATALATDLADICRALDVPHAGEAVAAIELLGRLAIAKQTGSEIPVNETRTDPRGRLALLHTHDMIGGVLEYLEPYVSEEAAREHLLTRVNSGDLEHCLLVRALFQASRQIAYGPIDAPAYSTLQG